MSGLLPREAPTSGPGSTATFDFLTVGSLIVNSVGDITSNVVRDLTVSTAATLSYAPADAVVTTDAASKLTGIALADGELLVGVTGGAPVPAAVAGGANIAVASSAGAITVSTVASPAFTGNQIGIAGSQTPATAASPGTAGTICWDAGYIYVCVAANAWVRVATATW